MRKPTTLGSPENLSKQVLTGLLALLLLAAVTVSANPSLHQFLHQDGSAAHLCLACAFAKGQLEAVETVILALAALLGLLIGTHSLKAAPIGRRDFRLAPSRAPPSN